MAVQAAEKDNVELELKNDITRDTTAKSLTPSTLENAPSDQNRSRFRVTAILIALYLSLFIAALDVTIVATAVPTISADLHSAAGYTWIGGAYLLANASSSPIWAKLSDIFGRKPIFLINTAIFFASSIVCALAKDMPMLIAGRAIQGSAGGGLIMMVNIAISDIFSPRERSLYLGFCEAIWAVAGGIGPVLGGVFTQLATWRWCWWLNLPVSGTGFVLILLFLDVHNPRTPLIDGIRAIDWYGTISMLALTLMLLLGLDFGGVAFPWSSAKVIVLIVIGSCMSIAFIYSEKRLAKYPLIPLGIFKRRSNVACLLVCFLHGTVFIATEYYLPLYFQSVKQASPLRSGVLLFPMIVMTAATGVIAGLIIHRTGRYRELIWIGTITQTLGVGLLISFGATTSIGQILGCEFVAGIGTGLLFEAPLIALQAVVEQDDIATATSTFSFARNLASAISIVVAGVVFQNSMTNRAGSLRAAGLPLSNVTAFSGTDAAANVMLVSTITDKHQQLVVKEAFAWSMRNMWILYTCLAFCGFLVGLFVTRQHLSREHTETVTGLKKVVKPDATELTSMSPATQNEQIS